MFKPGAVMLERVQIMGIDLPGLPANVQLTAVTEYSALTG
jgi:hypothetical protein